MMNSIEFNIVHRESRDTLKYQYISYIKIGVEFSFGNSDPVASLIIMYMSNWFYIRVGFYRCMTRIVFLQKHGT